jgi:hypothetical protein
LSRLTRPKYAPFEAPLQAAVDKIAGYYEKTGDSDAYTMAMREYLEIIYYYLAADFV